MVTAQLRVTQHTPHWPEHLPGSMAHIRQTRAASKPEQNIKKQKQQEIKLHRLSLTHTCSARGCCPAWETLHPSEGIPALLPEISPSFLVCTREWVHGAAFSTPRVTATPMGRDSPCCSPCHPHQCHGEGMSQLHLPGSDGRGCRSPFLPGPAAASHHKWVWPARKQQRNTHTQRKTAENGSAPQGINGQGPRETAAAPARRQLCELSLLHTGKLSRETQCRERGV